MELVDKDLKSIQEVRLLLKAARMLKKYCQHFHRKRLIA